MEGLGRLFDISSAIYPVDMDTGTNTGVRISLENYSGVSIVIFKGAGNAGEDLVVDIQQADAATAGNVKDLDVIDHFYQKQETTLDGDEIWERRTQTIASEVISGATVGFDGENAEEQGIYVFEISADDLDIVNGYYWLFLTIADVGGNPQLGCAFYIMHDMAYQCTPANLPNPLNPGSANV